MQECNKVNSLYTLYMKKPSACVSVSRALFFMCGVGAFSVVRRRLKDFVSASFRLLAEVENTHVSEHYARTVAAEAYVAFLVE